MAMDLLKGWLSIYLIGSLPVLAFYAAGLSGWFYDYPMGLFIGIFLVLLVPPALLVLGIPSAPVWNIAGLWVGAVLIITRILHGVLLMEIPLQGSEARILAAIVTVALAWATVWTWYFLVSERIKKT